MMMNLSKLTLLSSLIILIGISCNKNETDTILIGKWQLVEQLVDPGDGSGTFHPVVSNKTLELFSNGTFISNEEMCHTGSPTLHSTSGTYSLDDKIITPDNCSFSSFQIQFSIEGEFLIISLPCIEPCKDKYKKIEND
jgi:hypothetical protein